MPIHSADKVDHATVLFSHLIAVGSENSKLFKKEFKDGQIFGALPSSKIENWYAMVCWFETLMISYLGETKITKCKHCGGVEEQYDERRKLIKARYVKAFKQKKLMEAFDALNEWAQILMLEASSQGFLMKKSVQGEWIVKDDEAEEDEGEAEE